MFQSFDRARDYIRAAEQVKLLPKYIRSIENNMLRALPATHEDRIEIKEKIPNFKGFLQFVREEDPRPQPAAFQQPSIEKFTAIEIHEYRNDPHHSILASHR